jgi:outer membrane receptor protein involved in Fe transport
VASLGYTTPIMGGSKDLFANLVWQHTGSSYSQFENEVAGFGQVGAGGARLIRLPGATGTPVSSVTFKAQLPGYDLLNFRIGVKGESWESALFVNNLTDQRAALALDYERGRSARVGELVNQPRTIGVTFRKTF